jgi:exonuclease SbcD
MTRLLCTGDLHLGKGPQYADDRLGDQEQVWARILDLAVDQDCDAVLVAGDVFEGPLPTPEHYRAFLRPLAGFPLPIVTILGNGRHDSAMRSTSALEVLEAPELTIVTEPRIVDVAGVRVGCLPWVSVKRLVALEAGGDRDALNRAAAELLIEIARGLREDGADILLTHFSISGAALPNGLPVDELREPVLDLVGLEEVGFDAVVAAHIHKPQLLEPGHDGFGSPHLDAPILYVGSPMPLDFGEAETEHGCWILDIGDAGETATARFIPIESRPFVTIDFDHDGS